MKIKIITLLLIIPIVSFSQIINKGNFKIEDGYSVSIINSFTNKDGAEFNNYGDLHLKGDFINNGIVLQSLNPNTANGTTYFESIANEVQTISGTNPVSFQNMVINLTNINAKGVLVEDEMNLTIEKSLTLTNGDLRLVGEAQLIQKHIGFNANSGSTNMLRDQQGTANTYNFNYWSSPVSGNTAGSFTVGTVLFDGTDASINPFSPLQVTFSTGSPYNGTPSILDINNNVITALNLDSHWIYKFENGTINDGSFWSSVGNNGSLNSGLGFTMKGSGTLNPNQNYVFKGKPNDGKYIFTIGTNKSYLLGNPYPCALDANKFINDNLAATTGAIYYWEHFGGNSHSQSNYQGGYATYTLAGGTPSVSHPDVNGGGTSSGIDGSRYIPVAQGFFIESLTGGTISINNSQRIFKLENPTDSYFRTPNNETSETILERNNENEIQRIRLNYNNPNGFERQIMTAFISTTTDDFNAGYDAAMADIQPDDMYWLINNIPHVIDARPFAMNKQIPLGITVITSGTHEITLFETENFDHDIYILDTLTQTTYDLRTNNFSVNLDVGDYLNRFYLVFQSQNALNNNEVLNEFLQTFYASNNEQIIIKNPKNIILKNITIFNTVGQVIKKIKKNELINSLEVHIPFNVANGVYFINIETNIGNSIFKILAY